MAEALIITIRILWLPVTWVCLGLIKSRCKSIRFKINEPEDAALLFLAVFGPITILAYLFSEFLSGYFIEEE